jgi:FSR family fosmidomycin resistance protein-like MFS transporter
MNEKTTADNVQTTTMAILVALSFCHLTNDMIQSLLPSIYPILKVNFALDFHQIGLLTLTYQLTASLLQPMIGLATDKRPVRFSLPFGMMLTASGLFTLSVATTYPLLLLGAALLGSGSSVFHPESSRMARAASGGRHGFAQSFFQIGGNAGTALGPLLAAYVILPHGQSSIAWFLAAAFIAIVVLTGVSNWYYTHHIKTGKAKAQASTQSMLSRNQVRIAVAVLMALVFSKYFYLASLHNYYTFYLIHKFGVSIQDAQIYLFVFLAAVAIGTFAGGPIGDRIGRKQVIWVSILGTLPFSLALPHVGLVATVALSFIIGVIIASAFSAIIVYAQELIPGKPGMIAGLFFGFAFGMGGLGAALLGEMADRQGIETVYDLCAWLPLLGILTIFLPNTRAKQAKAAA